MLKKRTLAVLRSSKKVLSRYKAQLTYIGFFFVLLFVLVWAIGFGYQQKNKDQPLKLGVSFSKLYAEELGLNWQKTYIALLDDLGISSFRLMSYWDSIEKRQDTFDFTDLDWQMDQAAKRGATVSLAIGQRQPRWPECHIPQWINKDSAEYNDRLLLFVETVVKRYKNHPALASYQLENEAANSHFGSCPDFDRDLFAREFKLVQAIDPDTSIITNTSNQSGVSIQKPVGDQIGFSIYKRAHFPALGKQRSWSFWYVPSFWHSFRAAVSESLHDTDAFVHELQAEPWGPAATRELSFEEQNKTMDAEKLIDIVRFARSTGMNEIYLWGGEWWYWRYTQFNDKELWSTLYDLYQNGLPS